MKSVPIHVIVHVHVHVDNAIWNMVASSRATFSPPSPGCSKCQATEGSPGPPVCSVGRGVQDFSSAKTKVSVSLGDSVGGFGTSAVTMHS